MVLDPQLLSAEAACLLHQYVQLNTTNPPGNELRAATFLQAILQREGIESQIIEAVPGRANLVARYSSAITPSSSAQPPSAQPTSAQPTSNPQAPPKPHGAIMLAHHMDVVPADASEWSLPPFSGEVKDGYLWGRGSIDNKGGGIVQLLSVFDAEAPRHRDESRCRAAGGSRRRTKMFDAIEALARSQHPGAPVTTSVIGGFTDCNAFRALGLTCYGFIPLQLSLADIHRLHAADERVRLDSLGPAVVSLVQLLGLVDAPRPTDVPAALPPR